MKKQTTLIIIALLLGILATQYFLRKRHSAQEVAVLKEFVADENTPIEETPQPAKQTAAVIKVEQKKPESTPESETPTLPAETSTDVKEPNRIVELTLDESNLSNLESNMNDLSQKVTTSREERGWRVRYRSTDNPMSSIGIIHNDLVLYQVIQRAKKNSQTAPLVSRLENIFSTLESK